MSRRRRFEAERFPSILVPCRSCLREARSITELRRPIQRELGDIGGSEMRERRSSGHDGPERRRAPRLPLRIEVDWSLADAAGTGTTENLAVDGFFLCTGKCAPIDAVVELSLDLPDEKGPAKAAGRVRRVARRRNDTPGFAVEFEHLDESIRRRIAALVERAQANRKARRVR
jgi:hypothetical protein